MIRWRTVGLIDVPTDDGRLLKGTVTCRGGSPVPLFVDRRYLGRVSVRVRGNRIEALLRRRHRYAALELVSPPTWIDLPVDPWPPKGPWCRFDDPVIGALYVGPGSAWKALR